MSTTHSNKVILITGSSSGIGEATAVLLSKAGYTIAATARNLNKTTNLEKVLKDANTNSKIFPLDITDQMSIKKAVEEIIQEFGKIDVLINNAGITIDGFFEDHSSEDIEKIFKTNVFGTFDMTKAVLPHMRKQRNGHIINIGSIAGRWALPQIGIYSATKFAIEGFSEAIKYELAPFNIRVSIVEPCFVETPMVHQNRNVAAKSNTPESPYTQMNEICENFYEKYGKKYSIFPEDVAQAILKIINSKKTRFRYMLGRRENVLKKLQKTLPTPIFEKFLHKTFPSLK